MQGRHAGQRMSQVLAKQTALAMRRCRQALLAPGRMLDGVRNEQQLTNGQQQREEGLTEVTGTHAAAKKLNRPGSGDL